MCIRDRRKISRGEYEYYQEKIKLNEEMGGLFIPQPSELPTNITCNNSDKNVVGYVGVSMNVAKYRDVYKRQPLKKVASVAFRMRLPKSNRVERMILQ